MMVGNSVASNDIPVKIVRKLPGDSSSKEPQGSLHNFCLETPRTVAAKDRLCSMEPHNCGYSTLGK